MSKLRGLASRLGTLPSQLTLSAQQAEAPLALTATRAVPLCSYGAIASYSAQRFASSSSGFDDQKKQLVSNHLLVDTLDLARTFEGSGLPRPMAEQLAQRITELIVMNKMKMEETFVKQVLLEKTILEQEAKIMSFKNELSKTQDMHVATVNKDIERQQSYLDKMKAEVRHEIDKLSASQRLDMNLEKGRMRDDLQAIRDKTTDLQINVDRDINELRSAVEKAKNDGMKMIITILGTFSAVAFTISRFMQMSGGG